MAATNEQRMAQVATVLGELKRLHGELGFVVQQKLDAMRKADTDAIHAATAREEFLAQRIREQEGLRRQILQLIGEANGMPAARARAMTIRELAELAAEPLRSRLLAAGAALRETVVETAERNRVAAIVSQEMLKHFRQVYQVMARTNGVQGGYSWTGRAETRPGMAVFEAVG